MRTVSKRTHDYCHQCGWVAKLGPHHQHCVLQYNRALSEAITALVFAKEMLGPMMRWERILRLPCKVCYLSTPSCYLMNLYYRRINATD